MKITNGNIVTYFKCNVRALDVTMSERDAERYIVLL